MDKIRIRYYGLTDLASSFNIDLADKFMSDFDSDTVIKNVNDVIECFNILKYVDAVKNGKWGQNYIPILKSTIGKYLSTNINHSLTDLYNAVEIQLYSEFWELFEQFGLYKRFDCNAFSNFLEVKQPELVLILQNEKIVNTYDECLKMYFLSDPYNATILLDVYEVESTGTQKTRYIPKNITIEEKDDLLRQYIESDNPNLGYLELVKNIINRDVLRIKDKTRLLAKRRIEKEIGIFFEKNVGHKIGVSIEYSSSQKEEATFTQEDGITHLVYSLDWIKDNLDYSTLLNNFIYLFEYVDAQMRITLTSKESDIGAIESIFGMQSKNNYKTGWVFQHRDQISNIQLYSYINILHSLSIDIEDVLSWFFSNYLKEQFQIQNFRVNFPSKSTTYFEKCRTLAPEIESILKKFNLLVEDNSIDSELLEISSSHLMFSNCKSYFSKKYIYPKATDFSKICFLFFSDQCMLNYIENEKKSYKSFFELLQEKKPHMSDYKDYQKNLLDWLLENGYVAINTNDEIVINDIIQLLIIRDLYMNETINYLNYPEIGRRKIDDLIESNFLFTESSLFSRSEQHYLNYFLNKAEYGNSLDLRNMYVHGTQPQSEQNDSAHKFNYVIFIKLIILIIIKINDEVCNKEKCI